LIWFTSFSRNATGRNEFRPKTFQQDINFIGDNGPFAQPQIHSMAACCASVWRNRWQPNPARDAVAPHDGPPPHAVSNAGAKRLCYQRSGTSSSFIAASGSRESLAPDPSRCGMFELSMGPDISQRYNHQPQTVNPRITKSEQLALKRAVQATLLPA